MSILDIYWRAKQRGKSIPAVLLLGPQNPSIAAYRNVCPHVVYRRWYDQHPPVGHDYNAGYTYCHWYLTSFVLASPDAKAAHFHQIVNEQEQLDIPPSIQGYCDWWHGAIDAARDLGNYKLVLFCFSTGYPALPTDTHIPYHGFWQDPAVWSVLQYAADRGHVLGLHQYDLALGDWTNQWDIQRHKRIWLYLPRSLALSLKLLILEDGQEKLAFIDSTSFKQKIINSNRARSSDAQVIGSCLWTYKHTQGWEGDDWQPQETAYEEAILTQS